MQHKYAPRWWATPSGGRFHRDRFCHAITTDVDPDLQPITASGIDKRKLLPCGTCKPSVPLRVLPGGA